MKPVFWIKESSYLKKINEKFSTNFPTMVSKNNCEFLKLTNKSLQMFPSIMQTRNVFTVIHVAKVRKQKDIIKTTSCSKFTKMSWLMLK